MMHTHSNAAHMVALAATPVNMQSGIISLHFIQQLHRLDMRALVNCITSMQEESAVPAISGHLDSILIPYA